jgi:hypothetical protein
MSQIVAQGKEIFVKLCKELRLPLVFGLFYRPKIEEKEPLDGYLWIEAGPASQGLVEDTIQSLYHLQYWLFRAGYDEGEDHADSCIPCQKP